MDLSTLFKRVGKVAADNSPAILTALGVSGTITTAYLAAKGAFKSVDVLREAENAKEAEFQGEHSEESPDESTHAEPLTAQEKIEAVWQLYAPAAASAALTVTAIILAARVADRRNAAIASAYSVVEKSYAEYRAENIKKIGKKKEQELRDHIVQERVNQNPVSKSTLIVTKTGETLCYDMWSGRWFTSDMESIRKAVNDFNQTVIAQSYASLSDFYHLIGIPSTRHSDDIGWDTDKLLEVDFTGVIDEHGQPAIGFDFRTKPHDRFASAY